MHIKRSLSAGHTSIKLCNELKTKVQVTMFTNIEFKKAKSIKATWTKKLE